MRYPCTWTSYLDQNAYHLGMALQSNGPDARSGKYTYEEMMEVWTAANHTKSDVMMMWWYPSTLYQTYLGTDAEFLKVNLPPPTQECMQNRVLQEDQCSSNIKTRVGNASGACDEAAKPLLTITSTGFFNMIYNPLIPNPLQSPAYDAVKGFQLSSTQLGEIFSYWFNARDAREGVCQWVVDNIEYARKLIPQTKFPRSIQKDPDWGTLQCVAFGLSILAVVATLISLLTVYCRRKRLVMIFAQVEFLMLTLFGLLLVSFGATALAVPPSNRSCTTAVWFVLIGYTIFLIPLCLKISTINRLIQADGALATPQVTVPRRVLIGAVGFFGICAVIFLLAWTIVDPPQKHAAYELAPSNPTDTNFVVIQHHFCSSNQTYWIIVTLAWNSLLLGCASVLAFQSRHVRQDFNESQTLAIMIYSHFVFIILRIILLVFMPNEIDESVLTLCQSIIFSIDTLVTLIIYFLPKFLTTDETHRRASVRMVNRIFTRSQVEKLDDDSFSNECESNTPKTSDNDEGKQTECATEPIDSKAATGLRNRRSCRNCGLDPEVRAVDVEASPSTEAMES
ncbi:hypothetical protein MPSEU_000442500 [Mayamaea pseudoterrestris]|nr:hypothetical protein MPSEU_000442500 [Mayamaea pseudoterrestris]